MLAGHHLSLHKPWTSHRMLPTPGDSSCAIPGHHDTMEMQEIMGTSEILRREQLKQPEGLPGPRPSPTLAGARMCCPTRPGSASMPGSNSDHSANIQAQLFSLRGKANPSQLLLF